MFLGPPLTTRGYYTKPKVLAAGLKQSNLPFCYGQFLGKSYSLAEVESSPIPSQEHFYARGLLR